jgi:hypothetical protein
MDVLCFTIAIFLMCNGQFWWSILFLFLALCVFD